MQPGTEHRLQSYILLWVLINTSRTPKIAIEDVGDVPKTLTLNSSQVILASNIWNYARDVTRRARLLRALASTVLAVRDHMLYYALRLAS